MVGGGRQALSCIPPHTTSARAFVCGLVSAVTEIISWRPWSIGRWQQVGSSIFTISNLPLITHIQQGYLNGGLVSESSWILDVGLGVMFGRGRHASIHCLIWLISTFTASAVASGWWSAAVLERWPTKAERFLHALPLLVYLLLHSIRKGYWVGFSLSTHSDDHSLSLELVVLSVRQSFPCFIFLAYLC